MKFPYERFPSPKGQVPFPTLNIMIINPQTKIVTANYKVLVDSGAAGCVFHATYGEAIGINVRSGEGIPLVGATGEGGEQFLHQVTVVIGGHSVDLEVGFSYDLKFPFGLLGQKGFFEKFRVCFDLPIGDFEITPKAR